jgi:hypothetical protein
MDQKSVASVASIKEATQTLSATKIRLEERYKSEKERLEKLIKVISEKGYDPKNISEIRKAKEAELEQKIKELEKQVNETTVKLNAIEGIE